ncbi:MAG TPA: hypothetical protein VI913_03770 [Candidatus Peribacteraceae bacterium]|nr:hypothetical protein [Candidatus Peribacteraceae bacterium]
MASETIPSSAPEKTTILRVADFTPDEHTKLEGLLALSGEGGLSINVGFLHQHPIIERPRTIEQVVAVLEKHKETRSVIVRRIRTAIAEVFGPA